MTSEQVAGCGVTRRRALQGLAAAAAAVAAPVTWSTSAAANPAAVRRTQTLNGTWEFSTDGTRFDYRVDVPDFLLPFTWWIYNPSDFPEDEARIAGYGYPDTTTQGWYRRTVPIPASWKGRRVELQFDGSVTRFSDLTPDGHLPDRTY